MVNYDTYYLCYDPKEDIYYAKFDANEKNRLIAGTTPDFTTWDSFVDGILFWLCKGHKIENINLPKEKWDEVSCVLEDKI
jgi:hypothetical protein